jgi:hypothetical protein
MKTSLITLPVLIVPNWTKEFHVYIDASNYVIGTMLVQNPDDTIDKPIIYYANQLMTRTKNKYSTTKKEAFAMIYVVKKFHRYLL